MKKLTELYEGLELNETTYLGNALNMTMFGTNYAFSKLREQVTEINNRPYSYLEKLLTRFVDKAHYQPHQLFILLFPFLILSYLTV
jgi:hypothetical protein